MQNLVQQWARVAQVLYCPCCDTMIDTNVYLEFRAEPERTAIVCDECGASVRFDDWQLAPRREAASE